MAAPKVSCLKICYIEVRAIYDGDLKGEKTYGHTHIIGGKANMFLKIKDKKL